MTLTEKIIDLCEDPHEVMKILACLTDDKIYTGVVYPTWLTDELQDLFEEISNKYKRKDAIKIIIATYDITHLGL